VVWRVIVGKGHDGDLQNLCEWVDHGVLHLVPPKIWSVFEVAGTFSKL